MKFQDQREQVRTVAKDNVGAFIEDSDIDLWLNEAQRDLAARLRSLMKSVTGTVGAGSQFTLPADLFSVHSLRLTGQTTLLTFADDSVWASWSDTGGSPGASIYRIFGTKVVIYPDATGSTYTLEYEYEPADLVAGTDVSPLPTAVHTKMVNYARAHALWKGNDGPEGDRYMGLYEMGLPQPTIGNPRRIATPMTLTYQRGPFDSNPNNS